MYTINSKLQNGLNLPLEVKEKRKNFIVKKGQPFIIPVKGRQMIFTS